VAFLHELPMRANVPFPADRQALPRARPSTAPPPTQRANSGLDRRSAQSASAEASMAARSPRAADVSGAAASPAPCAIFVQSVAAPFFGRHRVPDVAHRRFLRSSFTARPTGLTIGSKSKNSIDSQCGIRRINVLNAVFGAYTDSVPMIVLSGYVSREISRPIPGLRQGD
jgi:hypothetical protein